MGSTILQPGEKGTITIPRHEMTGKHIFEISVHSNDPVNPVTVLTLKFDITQ